MTGGEQGSRMERLLLLNPDSPLDELGTMLLGVQVATFRYKEKFLRFRRFGRGEPIVLIHGLSGSGHWWDRNIKALSAHHEVLVVELVGYGSARRQRAIGIAENAQMLAEWLAELNLSNVTLIGHSLGGHVAMRTTGLVPERISHLVLVCSTGLLKGNPVRLALKLPQAGIAGSKSFLPRILFDSARAGLPNLWRSGTSLLLDSVGEMLPRLNVKTLVVWGGRDNLVPAALGRQLAASIPGSTYLEIPHAGHVAMVDAPEEFNAAVLKFIGSTT